jgi:uroporphyrin-3 C-methyltransferase
VIASVDSLTFPSDQPAAAPREPQPHGEGFWSRLGGGIWHELKQLVQVRNLERPEAPLLAPSQAYFLKENLRLRLLNARFDLIERNQTLFRADMQAALAWLGRYFDPQSKQVQAAIANLKQLSASGISIETPDISESLSAIGSFKAARETK